MQRSWCQSSHFKVNFCRNDFNNSDKDLFHISRFTSTIKLDDQEPVGRICEKLFSLLQEKLTSWTVTLLESNKIAIQTVTITIESEPNEHHKNVLVSWTNQDEDLGAYILGLLQNMG